MNYASQDQEYSARYGLRSSQNNIEVAQRIAEAKYRTLVDRDILFSEILNIHKFIQELNSWSVSKNRIPTTPKQLRIL